MATRRDFTAEDLKFVTKDSIRWFDRDRVSGRNAVRDFKEYDARANENWDGDADHRPAVYAQIAKAHQDGVCTQLYGSLGGPPGERVVQAEIRKAIEEADFVYFTRYPASPTDVGQHITGFCLINFHWQYMPNVKNLIATSRLVGSDWEPLAAEVKMTSVTTLDPDTLRYININLLCAAPSGGAPARRGHAADAAAGPANLRVGLGTQFYDAITCDVNARFPNAKFFQVESPPHSIDFWLKAGYDFGIGLDYPKQLALRQLYDQIPPEQKGGGFLDLFEGNRTEWEGIAESGPYRELYAFIHEAGKTMALKTTAAHPTKLHKKLLGPPARYESGHQLDGQKAYLDYNSGVIMSADVYHDAFFCPEDLYGGQLPADPRDWHVGMHYNIPDGASIADIPAFADQSQHYRPIYEDIVDYRDAFSEIPREYQQPGNPDGPGQAPVNVYKFIGFPIAAANLPAGHDLGPLADPPVDVAQRVQDTFYNVDPQHSAAFKEAEGDNYKYFGPETRYRVNGIGPVLIARAWQKQRARVPTPPPPPPSPSPPPANIRYGGAMPVRRQLVNNTSYSGVDPAESHDEDNDAEGIYKWLLPSEFPDDLTAAAPFGAIENHTDADGRVIHVRKFLGFDAFPRGIRAKEVQRLTKPPADVTRRVLNRFYLVGAEDLVPHAADWGPLTNYPKAQRSRRGWDWVHARQWRPRVLPGQTEAQRVVCNTLTSSQLHAWTTEVAALRPGQWYRLEDHQPSRHFGQKCIVSVPVRRASGPFRQVYAGQWSGDERAFNLRAAKRARLS